MDMRIVHAVDGAGIPGVYNRGVLSFSHSILDHVAEQHAQCPPDFAKRFHSHSTTGQHEGTAVDLDER
jgi:hypothetical protein